MDVRRAHAFDSRPMTDEPGKILTGGREGGGGEELGRVRNEGFNAYISRFCKNVKGALQCPAFCMHRVFWLKECPYTFFA